MGNKVQSFHHLPIGAQNATNCKRVTTTTTTTNEDDVTICNILLTVTKNITDLPFVTAYYGLFRTETPLAAFAMGFGALD